MAKKELNQEEQILYNELKKLAKRANQRILRIERLTGEKGLFSAKQLYDYLDVVEGISKTGRIRVSKNFSKIQMEGILKATKNYLEDTANTTQRELKRRKVELEKSVGKSISWRQFSTFYEASELYKWATEEFGSKFWKDFAPRVYTMSKLSWIEFCASYIDKVNDIDILDRLKALYDYLKE